MMMKLAFFSARVLNVNSLNRVFMEYLEGATEEYITLHVPPPSIDVLNAITKVDVDDMVDSIVDEDSSDSEDDDKV